MKKKMLIFFVGIQFLASCKEADVEVDSFKVVKIEKSQKVYEAQELLSIYLKDQEKSDEQFKGKAVFVTGYIDDISKGGYILLHDQIDMNSIICIPEDTLVLKHIRIGDKVVFRGESLGFLQGGNNIYLHNCVLGQ